MSASTRHKPVNNPPLQPVHCTLFTTWVVHSGLFIAFIHCRILFFKTARDVKRISPINSTNWTSRTTLSRTILHGLPTTSMPRIWSHLWTDILTQYLLGALRSAAAWGLVLVCSPDEPRPISALPERTVYGRGRGSILFHLKLSLPLW